MSGDVTPYTGLVALEHQDKPNFMATVGVSCQGFADVLAVLESLPGFYDLDAAVGVQLDVVGEWVGVSRDLEVPIAGVYFAWDTDGVGWDQGIWKGEFDPADGIVALPDDHYRTLIYATIAANTWDGTIPGAYKVWGIIFSGVPETLWFEGAGPITFFGSGPITWTDNVLGILIQDYGDMSMALAFFGSLPDPVTQALITGGYIKLKPDGVRIDAYYVQSVPDAPYFGFDVENNSISGWDVGAWGTPLT